jgi:hypothetical protein
MPNAMPKSKPGRPKLRVKKVKTSISLSKDLLDQGAKAAYGLDMSFSAFVSMLLEDQESKLSRAKAAKRAKCLCKA